MDRALREALSSPEILARDPEIVDRVLKSDGYKIVKQLLETGDFSKLHDNPIPGVTLNFERVNKSKNYPSQNDYSNLIHDAMIPENIPVSQILHNEKGSRVLVPYANIHKSSDDRDRDIQCIKEAIMAVCQKLNHSISPSNIITNNDPQGHCILQISNKHVNNLSDNKKFTELVIQYIKDKWNNNPLTIAIDGGYRIFRYNEYHQKYPLLMEKSDQNPGILQKLIHDPNVPPIIINVTNISGDNNIVINGNNNTVNVTNVRDAIEIFINHIKTQKPNWYKEKTWVMLSDIKCYFDKMFPQIKLSPVKFNNLVGDLISSMSERRNLDSRFGKAGKLKEISQL